jgi:hypothetical protein
MIPERLLWLAVLQQAKEDLSGPEPAPGSKRSQFRQQARNWIESPSRAAGSFLWVCDMLGFEVAYVRHRITSAKKISNQRRRPNSPGTPREHESRKKGLLMQQMKNFHVDATTLEDKQKQGVELTPCLRKQL